MYTLLVNDNNEIITTVRERIMQRSKLVDNLHILVNPTYKEHNMSEFTVMMEYILPVSREYHSEILVKSSELYKEKLEYKLPFDTCLTKEAGKIEVQLTFAKLEIDADGNNAQRIRKAGPAVITIVPVTAWSNVIADSALSAIDQRLIQAEAMLNAANEMNMYLYETKADNIMYDKEGKYVQLTANGTPIGDRVEWINNGGCDIVSFVINEDGDLIVTLSDGRIINVGNVGCKNKGVTFIPNISDDYILSWTNDGGLENPQDVDLCPFDEWNPVGQESNSVYMWEAL